MGLIEILVAVVILAVGFLAAARMQVTGMQYSQSAYFESQAYFMAGEMLARMRANVAGVRAGEYNNLSTSSTLSDPQCDTKLCSPAEIAAQDKYDWSRYLHSSDADTGFTALLPSSDSVAAKGLITQLPTGQYSVTIEWADERDSDDGKSVLRVDLITEA